MPVEIYPVPFVEPERQDSVLRALQDAGADGIQWDVMDGVYNKNNTMRSMGPDRIRDGRCTVRVPFEAHLMIAEPWKRLETYARAGCEMLIPHIEACPDDRCVQMTIDNARALGTRAGLALEPETPVERVIPYMRQLDMVLCMGVRTGYSGQVYIPGTEGKVAALREAREKGNYSFIIEVDGGMNAETARLVREAGAARIVAASYLLNAPPGEWAGRVRALRGE